MLATLQWTKALLVPMVNTLLRQWQRLFCATMVKFNGHLPPFLNRLAKLMCGIFLSISRLVLWSLEVGLMAVRYRVFSFVLIIDILIIEILIIHVRTYNKLILVKHTFLNIIFYFTLFRGNLLDTSILTLCYTDRSSTYKSKTWWRHCGRGNRSSGILPQCWMGHFGSASWKARKILPLLSWWALSRLFSHLRYIEI